MSQTWPRMMYRQYPDYRVAHTAEEGAALQKRGYVYDAWPVLDEDGLAPVPAAAEEQAAPEKQEKAPAAVKPTHCDVCGRHLRKFSHKRCKEEQNALAGA